MAINDIRNAFDKVWNAANFDGKGLLTPTFVALEVNQAQMTYKITIDVENSGTKDLTMDNFSATIICRDHNYTFETVSLDYPVTLQAGKTTRISTFGGWEEASQQHLNSQHTNATSILIDLKNAEITVNGITMKTDTYQISDPIPLKWANTNVP
ncbi:MAG: hypothetical protein NWF05_07345 [Candidatus Bathyarchaeota archaeon]|nr:hypothetical protein [Candidatus Bathyarchaeota archaeon]